MMDDDRLKKLVDQANRNGQGPPMMPPGFQPRMSGWICPVCHTEAEQRVEPVMIGGQPVPGGYKYLTLEDGTPMPVNVHTEEVLERDAEGNPTRVYETSHCFHCFNAWQKRQMMRDIRANVPQLERKKDA